MKAAVIEAIIEAVTEAEQAAIADARAYGTREHWELAECLARSLYDLHGALGNARLLDGVGE